MGKGFEQVQGCFLCSEPINGLKFCFWIAKFQKVEKHLHKYIWFISAPFSVLPVTVTPLLSYSSVLLLLADLEPATKLILVLMHTCNFLLPLKLAFLSLQL